MRTHPRDRTHDGHQSHTHDWGPEATGCVSVTMQKSWLTEEVPRHTL